jgi:adenine-specific DNA-methyltransferase
MLENRIRLGRELLNERGSMFVRCDYNGNMYVRLLMNEIFGEENFRNEIIIQRGLQTRKAENRFLNKIDSLFFYFKSYEGLLSIPETEKEHVRAYRETLEVLRKIITQDVLKNIEKSLYETLWMPFLSMPGEQKSNQHREIFGIKLYPPKGRHWAFSQENLNLAIEKGIARLRCINCGFIVSIANREKFFGKCPECEGQNFVGEIFSLYNQVNNNWTDIPGYEQDPNFPTRNSEILLKRVIESTSNEGDLVLDFFLGSGTTTATAHKLRRKWIGIEMGEHFYTVILPRMKKVLAYDKSGISKEKDVKEKYNEKTAGGFFKYHTLEQYEDALENIEFEEQNKLLCKLPDYFVKYMLEWETKNSNTFLNLKNLKNPFNYKLRIIEDYQQKEVKTDVIETFNYLLGLNVSRYKVLEDNGRKYVFVFGKKDEKNIAIVWRSMEDIDLEKDREIIEDNVKDFNPDEIYINSDATVKGFKAIEPLLKTLMFDRAGVK